MDRLHGIMPPISTPLTSNGSLDEPGLRRLIEYVLQGGVHGIVVLGSCGEGALLPPDVRQRALEVAVETVNRRVPVVAGTGEPGTTLAARSTRLAREIGVDAALVVPPFYYLHDQEGVKRHYRTVLEISDLPILAYHIPQLTKVPVAPETMIELAEQGTVSGMKDSGGNFTYYQQVVDGTKNLPGFTPLTGSDNLIFASLVYGGTGAISVRSQITPAVVVALYNAAQQGDWNRARALHDLMQQLTAMLKPGWIPSVKAALCALGICGPDVAAPNARWSDAELAEQRDLMDKAREAGLLDPTTVDKR